MTSPGHTAYTQQIWASDLSLSPTPPLFFSHLGDKTDMSVEMPREPLGKLSGSNSSFPQPQSDTVQTERAR